MSELKTKPTKKSASKFIAAIEHKTRREDSEKLLSLMEEITQQPAVMWGETIVGFGQYRYEYDSGCKGDWMKTGFAPRKSNLSVYLIDGFSNYSALLAKLGKHKLGKSCLYINKLADVDLAVLKKLITNSYKNMSKKYD